MVKRLRVFLDTNVIFSGLYSSSGAPNAILEAYLDKKVEIVISRQILEEIVVTISQKKPELLPTLYFFLEQAPFEIQSDIAIAEVNRWARIIDLPDAPILAAAIAAKPDYFVTGNTKHFSENVAKKARLKILTPSQFVKELER